MHSSLIKSPTLPGLIKKENPIIGRKTIYISIIIHKEANVKRVYGFPGAEDLGNMFQVKRDFEMQYCSNRDLSLARAFHPGLLTFELRLQQYGSRIPLS